MENAKFILKAKQGIVELSVTKIYEDMKNYKGGFDFYGILNIECGNLKIRNERFYSSSSALEEFVESIEKVYTSLQGEAIYDPSYEDNLHITIQMDNCGQAKIKIDYIEHSLEQVRVSFEMDSDQTYLLNTRNELREMLQAFY